MLKFLALSILWYFIRATEEAKLSDRLSRDRERRFIDEPYLSGDHCKTLKPCALNETCVNTPESYSCFCKPGFTRTPLMTDFVTENCEDADECSVGYLCRYLEVCINTLGSYRCDCISGYEHVDDKCVDINECKTDGICGDDYCTNSQGSYSCGCPRGHTKDVESKLCTDVDECLDSATCGPHSCVNTAGSYVCLCSANHWNPDGFECIPDDMNAVNEFECPMTYWYDDCGCPFGTLTVSGQGCQSHCDILDVEDCYKVLVHDQRDIDFLTAQSICKSIDAEVGFPKTEEQYDLLMEVIRSKMNDQRKSLSIWTSLERTLATGKATAADKEPPSFIHWYPDRRHNSSVLNIYLHVRKQASSLYQGAVVVTPTRPQHGVICYSKYM